MICFVLFWLIILQARACQKFFILDYKSLPGLIPPEKTYCRHWLQISPWQSGVLITQSCSTISHLPLERLTHVNSYWSENHNSTLPKSSYIINWNLCCDEFRVVFPEAIGIKPSSKVFLLSVFRFLRYQSADRAVAKTTDKNGPNRSRMFNLSGACGSCVSLLELDSG